MKHRILLTRKLPKEAMRELAVRANLDLWAGEGAIPRDELLSRVAEADGLISLLSDRIDVEVLDRASRLKVIANYAAGYDNVDVDEATRRGIPVLNTPGVLTEATADLAFALLLSVSRRIIPGHDLISGGSTWTWSPTLLLGMDLNERALGVIGAGEIGSALLRRAKGFGMKLIYHSRTRKPKLEEELGVEYMGMDELLRTSDFLSLHVPLNDNTRRMIGTRELSMMKEGSVLINTARGPVVDEEALYGSLKEGHLGGAGLDVFEREPEVHPGLLGLDNVVLTPHLGSATIRTRSRMAEMTVSGLFEVLEGGRPDNCVNPGASDPQHGR